MTPVFVVLLLSAIVTAVTLYYSYGIISYARLPDTDLKEENF